MEKEGRFLISGLKIEDANLYMAEHLRWTMYFPLLRYWTLVNLKIGGLLHP
jgi:hypothetical protein